MPTHPLVKQAATALNTDQDVVVTLKVRTNRVPLGRYEFAIYQWRFLGIREHLVIKPIASSQELTPHLNYLLEKAVDGDTQGGEVSIDQEALEKIAPAPLG